MTLDPKLIAAFQKALQEINAGQSTPITVAPEAPVAPSGPLTFTITMGNPEPQKKGFTQLVDTRTEKWDRNGSFVRIGKLYVPPALMAGRQGVVTLEGTLS